MKRIALAILFLSTQSFAVCTKPVTLLEEGAKTECTGYLFTPEKELEVRIKVANYDNMEKLVKKTEELNTITENRLNLYIDQNQKLMQTINTQQQTTFLQNAGFFVLGVLITGYIAININK